MGPSKEQEYVEMFSQTESFKPPENPIGGSIGAALHGYCPTSISTLFALTPKCFLGAVRHYIAFSLCTKQRKGYCRGQGIAQVLRM